MLLCMHINIRWRLYDVGTALRYAHQIALQVILGVLLGIKGKRVARTVMLLPKCMHCGMTRSGSNVSKYGMSK